jgi:hypothetical protein
MKTFKQLLFEASAPGKNTHMTHLEDLVIYGGVDGTRQAINALRSMRDMLAGNAKASTAVTVKWDGCVSPDTIIVTEAGEKSIKQYHDDNAHNEVKEKVLGRDLDRNLDILTDVFGTLVENGEKSWLKIELQNGGIVELTEDHEVYLTDGRWKMAKDLLAGDDIHQLN